jgi:polyhydroxybutyrate depolymerase
MLVRMWRMKTVILVSLLVLLGVLVMGCSKKDGSGYPLSATPAPGETPGGFTATRSAGTTHGTWNFGGQERTFRLFIPFGIKAGEKVPLVVALHGGLGSGDQFAAASGFESLARDEGFVVVFPDGVGNTWNGGGCCGQAARQNIDDVGFLAALIDLLVREAPVDASRVFMTGHSNGAIMAFRFGCERPEMVKGIAPVAGSLEIPQCNAAKGTNLLAIHGDADQNHPIDGGKGPRSIAGVDFVSMEKTLSLWTAGMGCSSSPQRTTSGTLTTTEWDGCKDGTIARYIVIVGADHPWPGSTGGALGTPATKELDATKTVWSFFKGL